MGTIALLILLAAASYAQDAQLDRYLTSIAKSQWEARAARVAALRTPEQIHERQRYIRETVLQEIGGFPQRTPLNPKVTGTLIRDGYKVEKLIYESLPN